MKSVYEEDYKEYGRIKRRMMRQRMSDKGSIRNQVWDLCTTLFPQTLVEVMSHSIFRKPLNIVGPRTCNPLVQQTLNNTSDLNTLLY